MIIKVVQRILLQEVKMYIYKMEILYVVLTAVITVFTLTFLTRMKQGMSPLDVVNDATTSAISTIKQEKTAGNPSERKAIGLALELYSEDK